MRQQTTHAVHSLLHASYFKKEVDTPSSIRFCIRPKCGRLLHEADHTLVKFPIWHFTLFHHHSSSFVIFRDIKSDCFSRLFAKVPVFWQELTYKFISFWKNSKSKINNYHEKPGKTVRFNIAIFRDSSWTMAVTICQFPPSLTNIRR